MINKIDSIVVVGGGSAGWMTAATLVKAFPNKKITVIESKNVPTVGVGESTITGIRNWTRFIGLDESSFFPATDASLKLSIKFTDFYKKDFGSFHYPFGIAMADNGRNPFFDWQLKKYFNNKTDINDFAECMFPSMALIQKNKYSLNKNNEFDSFDPQNDTAYHFDATKFGIWLRNYYCLPKGVNHIQQTVIKVNTNDKGIESLVLENKNTVVGDLYIDCTGWKSLLLGEALSEPFNSYSDMLPNNRAWAAQVQYKDKDKELEIFTNCTAIENGWCWNIPLWSRLGTGYVYSDKFISPDQAKEEYKKYLMSNKMVIPRTKEEVENLDFKDIKMRVGIHEKTFVKNVVAIGLSAGFIEPLESNGLFSVHEFLFKLVDILQRGQISQFDRDMYNVSVRNLFHGFAKFVALHYALSHRDDTLYWKEIQEKAFTDSSGDPYSFYTAKSDAFYNMTWRYMEQWRHPYALEGIPFISTGMNINMMNDARYMFLSYRSSRNLEQEAKHMTQTWEIRKNKWNKNAESAKSLKEFLENNFYKK